MEENEPVEVESKHVEVVESELVVVIEPVVVEILFLFWVLHCEDRLQVVILL